MKRVNKVAISLGFLASLAACGGSSAGNVIEVPPKQTGTNGANFTEGYILTLDGVNLSNRTDDQAGTIANSELFKTRVVDDLPNNSLLENGEITTARTESDDTFAVVFGNTNTGPLLTQYGRLTSTAIPANGSASFEGSYAGIVKDSDGDIKAAILGESQIDVDFSNSAVSGLITGRFDDDSGRAYEDIRLLAGVIDGDGFIQGNAIAGEPTSGGVGLSNGRFGGVIGAEDASEVAGYTRVNWQDFRGDTFNEAGAFLAIDR